MLNEYSLIVDRIKELMREKKIQQKDLADAAAISESEITRILRQQNTKISHRTILALCDYFEVSADYLLGRSNEKNHEGAAK
ncbi:MAG TPA: helix-turn-helix transcriptional regulator [Lachnospiraceae bacterium]|nr:helix-turn-helix transcriptional regulator [Lachnospiraceae bacterium]